MRRARTWGVPKTIRRKTLIVMAVCLALMIVLVVCLLHMYQRENEQIFDSLVEESVVSAHRWQTKEARRNIQESIHVLEAVAAVYGTSQAGPAEVWSTSYLDAIRELDDLYEVTYYPARELQATMEDPDATALDLEMAGGLLSGETVISDVVQSSRLDGLCVFGVAVPVVRDGQTVGAISCLMKGELLLWPAERQESDYVENVLLTSDGAIILSGEAYGGGQTDILEALRARGASEEDILQVQEALGEEESQLITIHGLEEGDVFLMMSALGHNDWVLLSFARSADIMGYSKTIMRNTTTLLVALLATFFFLMSGGWFVYRQQRESILRSQARYDLLAEFSDTVLFEYDHRDQTMVFTPNIAARFQIEKAEMFHPFDNSRPMAAVHPEDVPLLQAFLRDAEEMTGDQAEPITLRLLDREGTYRWVSLQGQLLRDQNGRPAILVGKLADVHEQHVKELRLIQRSSIDGMTGALNRETTQDLIEQKLREMDSGFLFMLDVDDFKAINDNLGHLTGDRLLMRLVEEVKRAFRCEDVVGRIGGDEFIVFMGNTSDTQVAAREAEMLLQRFAAWKEPMLSASIGIASYPGDGRDYETLYGAADAAMYCAKRSGKNRWHMAGQR